MMHGTADRTRHRFSQTLCQKTGLCIKKQPLQMQIFFLHTIFLLGRFCIAILGTDQLLFAPFLLIQTILQTDQFFFLSTKPLQQKFCSFQCSLPLLMPCKFFFEALRRFSGPAFFVLRSALLLLLFFKITLLLCNFPQYQELRFPCTNLL